MRKAPSRGELTRNSGTRKANGYLVKKDVIHTTLWLEGKSQNLKNRNFFSQATDCDKRRVQKRFGGKQVDRPYEKNRGFRRSSKTFNRGTQGGISRRSSKNSITLGKSVSKKKTV